MTMTRDNPHTTDATDSERPPFIKPHVTVVTCHFCNRTWHPEYVDGFDLSQEDEIYPNMVPVCPEHGPGCR